MSWAKYAKKKLLFGEEATVKPRGHSMVPLVKSGAKVTVSPIADKAQLAKGDIVLVTVRGRTYLHLIKAVQGKQYLIGNNKGGTNGWAHANNVHGIATEIDNG